MPIEIDLIFRTKLNTAIDAYHASKGDKKLKGRAADFLVLKAMINTGVYLNRRLKNSYELADELQTYLSQMKTGWCWFGKKQWRVNTGHSKLKMFVEKVIHDELLFALVREIEKRDRVIQVSENAEERIRLIEEVERLSRECDELLKRAETAESSVILQGADIAALKAENQELRKCQQRNTQTIQSLVVRLSNIEASMATCVEDRSESQSEIEMDLLPVERDVAQLRMETF